METMDPQEKEVFKGISIFELLTPVILLHLEEPERIILLLEQ